MYSPSREWFFSFSDSFNSATADLSLNSYGSSSTVNHGSANGDGGGGGGAGGDAGSLSLTQMNAGAMESPLHKCAKENLPLHLTALLEHIGPDGVECINGKRMTALSLACQKGSVECVKVLLRFSTNVNASSETGSTPLIQASHFGHTSIVDMLIKHGAEVDLPNFKQTTALMRASQEGRLDIVKLLLRSGADVNRRNEEHMSSLMLSCQRGHHEIAELFCKMGADVDLQTNLSSTALMLATKRGHRRVVLVLLTYGADLEIRDKSNRHCIETAIRRGHEGLSKFLTKAVQRVLMALRARRQSLYYYCWLMSKLQGVPNGRDVFGRDWPPNPKFGSPTLLQNVRASFQSPDKSRGRSVRLLCDILSFLPLGVCYDILSFAPLPSMRRERFERAKKAEIRRRSCPTSTTQDILDSYFAIINEVLEEDCDIISLLGRVGEVDPPEGFEDWEMWGRCRRVILLREQEAVYLDVKEAISSDSSAVGCVNECVCGGNNDRKCVKKKDESGGVPASKKESKEFDSIDSRLITAYSLSCVSFLSIISSSRRLRRHLEEVGISKSLARALGDIADVEMILRKRKNNIVCQSPVVLEVADVVDGILKWVEGRQSLQNVLSGV